MGGNSPSTIPNSELVQLLVEGAANLDRSIKLKIKEDSSPLLKSLREHALRVADRVQKEIEDVLAEAPEQIGAGEDLEIKVCSRVKVIVAAAEKEIAGLSIDNCGRRSRKDRGMYDTIAALFRHAPRKARGKLNDEYGLKDERDRSSATEEPELE